MLFRLSFPRHVKRTFDLLSNLSHKINLLIWVSDSRIPFLTTQYLVDVIKKIDYKNNIVVFVNKMDLVESFPYEEFESYCKKIFLSIKIKSLKILYGSYQKTKSLRSYMTKIAKEEMFINSAVIGLPNVGKSTIINSLVKKGKCKTSPTPGTTKSFQWILLDYNIKLLDLPGVVLPYYVNENELSNLLNFGIINNSFVNYSKKM